MLCLACSNVVYFHGRQLATARKLVASQEILLWMTPSETPKALQASECSELLDGKKATRMADVEEEDGWEKGWDHGWGDQYGSSWSHDKSWSWQDWEDHQPQQDWHQYHQPQQDWQDDQSWEGQWEDDQWSDKKSWDGTQHRSQTSGSSKERRTVRAQTLTTMC